MPDQTPFIATATKAPSCTLCGIEGPKNFLLPNNTKYGEKESPCKHDVGVCNCCWLEYLTIEVTKAQAISQTEQKTNLTEIKCIECEKVLRKVDIFMRGGSDVFDVYQAILKSESQRAAELVGARNGKKKGGIDFVQNIETMKGERYNAFNTWKWKD